MTAGAEAGSTDESARPRQGTKSGEALARRIQKEIAAEGWLVGKLIGTEPELLKRYKVSRPVLREAVRLLEHHMVAESRRGAGGGLRVTAPELSTVAQTAALYLDYLHVSADNMYSGRAVIEVRCVELATERIDEDGRMRLRDLISRIKTTEDSRLSELNHMVETVIAESCGDPVVTLFVKVLLQLAYQHGAPVEERLSDEGRLQDWRSHQVAIAEAVLAGDADAAGKNLLSYLDWAAKYARRHFDS